MQDHGILGSQDSFLFGILLELSKQGISNSISFALMIIDPKVVLKIILSSTNMPRAPALYIYKVAQVVMVYKIKDLMLITV